MKKLRRYWSRSINVLFFLISVVVLLSGCAEITKEVVQSTTEETVKNVEQLIGDIPVSDGESCLDGEVYEEEEQICRLDIRCDTPEACALAGDDIIAELEQQYGSLTYEESVATDGDLQVIATYEVDNDLEEIVTYDDVPQETVDYHGSLWFNFAWLIPEGEREDLTRFEVFESGDTLAHVYIHDEEATSDWTLGMNKEEIEYASETMITYIHEFSHLLSLRETEVDYYSDSCSQMIEDYCFFEDAYMTYFYDQFYADGTPSYSEKNYISEYAATSAIEDFAESFAHFVLTPEPEGNTLAEEKVLFFYQFENLVELRANILSRASTWMDWVIE